MGRRVLERKRITVPQSLRRFLFAWLFMSAETQVELFVALGRHYG